jgi:hypothetical protein
MPHTTETALIVRTTIAVRNEFFIDASPVNDRSGEIQQNLATCGAAREAYVGINVRWNVHERRRTLTDARCRESRQARGSRVERCKRDSIPVCARVDQPGDVDGYSPADSNETSIGRPTYCSARLVIAARELVR